MAAAAPLPNTGESDRPYLAVVSPVFNDWGCVPELLARLDQSLGSIQGAADVYLVDDGSTLARSLSLAGPSYQAIRSVWLVRLKRNLGHQRAIAVGLGLVSALNAHEAVLVLDSDGEDRPEDVPRLYAAMRRTGGNAVVFA